MGAHSSCFGGFTAKRKVETSPGEFADKYSSGVRLGRGAFGIVYSCKCKRSGQEYAVKMVSRHKSSLASIKREAGMLRKLAHPCVVQLHDVYTNTHTVDMVFDIYHGGDMVAGMQHYSNSSKGDIPMAAIQRLSWQMFLGINWLHYHSIVHRDVKADNYLLDHADLAHPECRVFLSDFGTAVEVEAHKRLEERCGTQLYWAPEFFAQSYALKVDVWALGVVIYGLVTGRFPFAGEQQVHTKSVEVPSRCGEAGESFLLGTLERSEDDRLSAGEALQHPFLAHVESATRMAGACSEASPHLRSRKGSGGKALPQSASCMSEATTAACSSRCDENKLLRFGSTVDEASPVGLSATF